MPSTCPILSEDSNKQRWVCFSLLKLDTVHLASLKGNSLAQRGNKGKTAATMAANDTEPGLQRMSICDYK